MKTYFSRYAWFVLGVLLNSFGVALITKAALGTSPISSVPYVLSFQFSPSFGQMTFLVNMLFILGQALLLRRGFRPIQLLQIVVNVIFSACIDGSMALLTWLEPAGLAGELAALTLGCAVLGLGISIEVAPGVLMVPGEGVVKAIAQTTGLRFGSIKVAFDVSLITSACLLSFLFLHRLQGLGLGTVVSALIVGQFVNFFNKRLPLIARIAELGRCAA